MAKNHPLFHKFKTVIGYSIATVVIIAALTVSGLRLMLSTANVYQYEVEQLASNLFKQPVKIGRMDARLTGLTPTLVFHNLELLSSKTNRPLFSLARADVGILFKDLIFKQKITPAQLTISGMNLFVTRTVEGHFKVKGVDLAIANKSEVTESNQFFERWLLQQGEVAIEDSTFAWRDDQNAGLVWFFDDVNILLKKTHERHQLLLSSRLPGVLGDKIKVAIDLVGDLSSPRDWDIKSYIESNKLNLAPLQKYISNKNINLIEGVADFKLWLDWKKESVQHLSGDIELNKVKYRLNKKKAISLKHVSGIFDGYLTETKLWNVSIDRFNYESDARVLNNTDFSLALSYRDKEIDSFYIHAKQLQLNAISKIILDNHFASEKHENQIKNMAAQGDVQDLFIAWQDNNLYKLNARFKELGINAMGNVPKLKKISGNIKYEEQKGTVSISSKNSTVGFPKLFRNDFNVEHLDADIEFLNFKQGILFNIDRIESKSSEVSSVSAVKLWLPKDDSSPYMDLQTYLSNGDVSKTSYYLPTAIMDKSLVKWLESALLGGKLNKGTVLFNGKLDEFPFRNKEGEFTVGIEASDFHFNYKEGWPEISKSTLSGVFTGQGMKLNMSGGEVSKNVLSASSAEIKSFSAAEVELDLAATGSTHNTLQFLINSPILPEAKKTVNSMKLTGQVKTRVKVNIPLAQSLQKNKKITYSGSAELNNVALYMLDNKIDITKGFGTVEFSNNGVSSNTLSGNIIGKPATFVVSSTDKNIMVSADGSIDAQEILTKFDIPGAKNISGTTPIQASMNFPVSSKNKRYPLLSVKSDLTGVKSVLPEKFHKNEDDAQEFEFTTHFVGNDWVQVGIEFGNKGSVILELDQSKKKPFLRKGAVSISSNKAELPRKNILYIDGSVKSINLQKWNSALGLDGVRGKQTFFVKPVVFNLDELKIITTDEKDTVAKTVSIPGDFPVFEGIVKKFHLNNDFIGRLDFKVSRKKYGLHLDELIISSRNMKIFSHGDWLYTKGKHNTNMNFTLSSHNFGAMLTDLGYAVVIDKGTAQAVGKINWNGTPTQFSLKRLNAEIQLKLKDGSLLDVDPGAGRLLGLFSLSALPRRIFGDFKDTSKKGFSFDSASGEIRIEEGDVYTDEFELNSPIANVLVSGRVGLVDRDYDNVIEVIPDVGSGVAGVTALLVNLPAGIGLWILDKVTGEQFDEASSKIYDVTGTWDNPEIVLRSVDADTE
ncbi:MAG: DUF3971 domain-containing protein [Gammaproteobacteria bacterium]|nr:DUF3971 domain-containing protein [Gammaproteobacteria bacterium]